MNSRETQTPEQGPCAWCGKTTTKKLELEKQRYRRDPLTGVRIVAKHAITAWVCSEHDQTLVRTVDPEAAESAPVLK